MIARAGRCLVCAALALLAACQTDRAAQSAPAKKPPADAAPAQTEAPGTLYEVKAGDTLWGISHAHGIDPEELAEVNGLLDKDQLQVGQLLFIPDDGLGTDGDVPPAPMLQTMPDVPRVGQAPFVWPIDGGVMLMEFSPGHKLRGDGIILAAPQGTEVRAAGRGTVLFAGEEQNALGRLVIIQHEDDLLTIYGHLAAAGVHQGDVVGRGQAIGQVGETGRAESPQLHFQVRKGRTAQDPLAFLPPP